MFANPEVSTFIDRLIGGQTPRGGTPPQSQGYRTNLARSLLGDITPPAIRGGFTAPAIRPGRGLEPSLPSEGVGRGGGSGAPGQADFRGGAGQTGASGLAAGIGKVGAGIENALDQLAANKQNSAEIAALGQGGAFPKFGGGVAGDTGGNAADSSGASLPSFARQPGVSAETPSTAPSGAGAGLKNQIAQHIVDYAIQRGVDPYRALGIAAREGLDRQNPLATNPDGSIGGVPNTAVGFYQFGTAGLGKQLGISASTPWKTQAEMAIDYMATHSPAQVTGQWHSIPDNGGWNAIRDIGRGYAAKLGISPGGGQATAPSPTPADIAQDRQQDAADATRGASSTTPSGGTGIVPQPAQQGIYNGQPYTYQTQPALGQQGMLYPSQGNPIAAPAQQEQDYFSSPLHTMPPGSPEMPKSLAPLPDRQFPTGPGNLGIADASQLQISPLALALAGGQMSPVDPNFGGSGSGLFG